MPDQKPQTQPTGAGQIGPLLRATILPELSKIQEQLGRIEKKLDKLEKGK